MTLETTLQRVEQMREFVAMIARMETADEFDERTDGEGMSGDDAVDTVSGLVRKARELIA